MWFQVASGNCLSSRFLSAPWNNNFKADVPPGAWIQTDQHLGQSHEFKHIYIANVKRFLTNEYEDALVLGRLSLKRAFFHIVRQRTAPPHISWATWFIWALLYFIIQHLSKYNIVLGWILRKENTIPENSHFGSSLLYAIFPLYLILIHNTSWNKYWVALKRQVKNTAIFEEEHWTFGL